MKYYANMSCFFNQDELWSFNKFITDYSKEQIIYIDKLFQQQLTIGFQQESINISLNFEKEEIQQIQLQEQKRSYKDEFLEMLNFEIYDIQISLGELTKLLIKNQYVDQNELIIYKKYKDQYIIESGKIFGVPLVFYDKNDIEHKHSLYLVDYFIPQTWKEIYRKIRLAQEVKKKFLLIIFDEKNEIIQTRLISNFQ